jgi:hypothetical protein
MPSLLHSTPSVCTKVSRLLGALTLSGLISGCDPALLRPPHSTPGLDPNTIVTFPVKLPEGVIVETIITNGPSGATIAHRCSGSTKDTNAAICARFANGTAR